MRVVDILRESDSDHYVYHGGSYKGGDYNPSRVGEPGNIRPLGKGLYAAATPEHAQLYVRYGGDNGAIQKFVVDPKARLYPWGGAAWRELSPDQADWWRAKAAEIQQAFEQAGLVRKNYRNEFKSWPDALSQGDGDTERMRQVLASLGVDGSRQVLGDGMVEYVFYNTSVLKPVN